VPNAHPRTRAPQAHLVVRDFNDGELRDRAARVAPVLPDGDGDAPDAGARHGDGAQQHEQDAGEEEDEEVAVDEGIFGGAAGQRGADGEQDEEEEEEEEGGGGGAEEGGLGFQ
jgi:hypothetical protein